MRENAVHSLLVQTSELSKQFFCTMIGRCLGSVQKLLQTLGAKTTANNTSAVAAANTANTNTTSY